MTKKTKKDETKKLVYWRPCSTIEVNGKVYKHGDPVDDWPADVLEKKQHLVRPAKVARALDAGAKAAKAAAEAVTKE